MSRSSPRLPADPCCHAVRLIAGVRAGRRPNGTTCILHIGRVGGPCPAPERPTPDGYPQHCQARPAPAETRTLTGAKVLIPQCTPSLWRTVMSHPHSAAHYEPPPADVTPPSCAWGGRRPVEAIAGWSARHRETAVFGWLALVAVAYLIGGNCWSPPASSGTTRRPGLAPAAARRPGAGLRQRPQRAGHLQCPSPDQARMALARSSAADDAWMMARLSGISSAA